jgi:hypothetical protein
LHTCVCGAWPEGNSFLNLPQLRLRGIMNHGLWDAQAAVSEMRHEKFHAWKGDVTTASVIHQPSTSRLLATTSLIPSSSARAGSRCEHEVVAYCCWSSQAHAIIDFAIQPTLRPRTLVAKKVKSMNNVGKFFTATSSQLRIVSCFERVKNRQCSGETFKEAAMRLYDGLNPHSPA